MRGAVRRIESNQEAATILANLEERSVFDQLSTELPKLDVASSSLVARSKPLHYKGFFMRKRPEKIFLRTAIIRGF